MAIAFLNNITFSGGAQAEKLRLENLGADPASGNEGQLYFNTATDKVRVYANGAWTSVDGANDFLTGLSFNTADGVLTATVQNQSDVTVDLDGRYIPIGNADNYDYWTLSDGTNSTNIFSTDTATFQGTTNEVTVTESGGTITVGLPDDVTIASQLVVGNTGASEAPIIHSKTGGTGDNILLESTNTGAGSAPDLTLYRNAGVPADSDTLGVVAFRGRNYPNTGTNTYNGIYSRIIDASQQHSALTFSAYYGSSTAHVMGIHNTANSSSSGKVVINPSTFASVPTHTLDVNGDADISSSLDVGGALTVSGTGQSSFAGQVTIPQTPVANTDAASKAYVDSVVEGGLIYQGGYNPSTNTPDLTTSPNSILKGWTYTVTADGTFFGEQLRVGDVLIAEQDDPSALTDWTTVQNNIDLASLTQVGIGNVNASTGINVTYSSGTATVTNTGVTSLAAGEGIDVSGSTGGVTVSAEDSSASNKGIVIVAGGNGIDVSYSSGTATVSAKAKRLNLNNTVAGVSRAEAGGITTFTINVIDNNVFGANTDPLDVMVEVIGNAVNAGETVYAETGRSGNNITVKFIGSVANGDYQVLLNYVG